MTTLIRPNTIETILERLASIEQIRYVALDQGQLDQYSDSETARPPIATPALLVSLTGETLTPYKGCSEAILTIDIRLITDCSTIANYAAPSQHIAKATTPYSLIPEVVERLTGVDSEMAYLGFDEGMRQRTLSELKLHFRLRGLLHE